MKRLFLVLVVSLLAVLAVGCGHEHEWLEADCVTPKTCAKCEKTEGEPLGHTWTEATCLTAKTCSVCGETEGEPAGHTWIAATCVEPKTCSVCKETEGELMEHDWAEATCTEPETCKVCGETKGEATGHVVKKWNATAETGATCVKGGEEYGTCEVCGEELTRETEPLGHNPGKWKVTQEATITTEGKRTKTCKRCGIVVETETFELSADEKEEGYKKTCKNEPYTYTQIARNPDNYIGEDVVYTGKVVQVMEDGKDVMLRVALDDYYDEVFYVEYERESDKEDHILEDDIVTMYGKLAGSVTYETILGGEVTIPGLYALFIDIKY